MPPATVAPSVPFSRVLKSQTTPMTGDDVLAVKIAVSRMGFWPWREFDDTYNKGFANGQYMSLAHKAFGGVRGLRDYLGLTPGNHYNETLHNLLLTTRIPAKLPHAGEFAFDAHSLHLYGLAPSAVEAHRGAIVTSIFGWWDWMVSPARNPSEHYLQYRPMKNMAQRNRPPVLPSYSDCSSTFIYCAFLGGAKSPDVANGFSGYGNTGSLIQCGTKIAESEITKYAVDHYVGAFYGSSYWNTHHISAVKSPTEVYSMGNENAPERWPNIHYLHDFLELRAYPVL